jgi:hypothetical protein
VGFAVPVGLPAILSREDMGGRAALPSLVIEVDAHESPDYLVRRIWFGFGRWKSVPPVCRLVQEEPGDLGHRAGSGHAYEAIAPAWRSSRSIRYLALVNGGGGAEVLRRTKGCASW